MIHRKLMAVVYNVHTTEIYSNYFHNDLNTLEKWMAKEGYADSPDFDFFVVENPFLKMNSLESVI